MHFSLREMTLTIILGEDYRPNYIRTVLTTDLHEWAGFRTDTEIVPIQRIKKLIRNIKNVKDDYSLVITAKSVVKLLSLIL